MNNESPTSSSESVGSAAPFYTTSYVIDLGRFAEDMRNQSEFRGKGVVEITESGLILRFMQRRSWPLVLLASLLVYSIIHMQVMPALGKVLRDHVYVLIGIEVLMLAVSYEGVRALVGRQLADTHPPRSIHMQGPLHSREALCRG